VLIVFRAFCYESQILENIKMLGISSEIYCENVPHNFSNNGLEPLPLGAISDDDNDFT